MLLPYTYGMEIVPVINCPTIRCFRSRAEYAAMSLKSKWIHVDIEKKPFTEKDTALCVRMMRTLASKAKFEAHYMAVWNRKSFSTYVRRPFSRIYVHASQCPPEELAWAREICAKNRKELGIAYAIGDMRYKKHPSYVKHALVLAVHPGSSGQKFHASALSMIRFLKKKFPDVTITVDGGMNPAVLRNIARAGADRAVSSSFIWNSEDPVAAYKMLRAA